MTGEPLSAVDAAWLRMDRPTNPMVITSACVVERALAPRDVEPMLERLLAHARFRQRPVTTALGRLRWEQDPHFSLASHLHHVALPSPGDDAALRELVGDLLSTPLDRNRPLWTVHVVDGYRGDTVLVVRLHHCIADGIALVRLLLELTDHEAGAAAPDAGAPAGGHGAALRLGRVIGGARALARDLLLPRDAPTPLAGALGVRKRVAWCAPAALEPLHALAHAHGGTLNDVFMAAIAGALRGYLTARTGEPPSHDVRALVPVNLRRVFGGGETGNRFGLVYVTLPLGEPTAAQRMQAVQERMRAIKSTPEAAMAFGLLGAMGLANAAVERFGVELFSEKATVMFTSVPGPATTVRLAGRPLRDLLVWAPASGRLGLTLSAMSYAGAVRIGVAADERLVHDPELVAAALDLELRQLARMATAETELHAP